MRTRQKPTAQQHDEDGLVGPVFQVFKTTISRCHYEVYLSHPIEDPFEYDELCQLLRSAEEEDSVTLYLNTPGGDMTAGLALIQSMRDSLATVTTVLHPQAFSMGALLFLAGDDWIAPENGLLMLHNYSSGLSGKGNEQVAEVHAQNAWFERVMRDVCSGFLTKQELKLVLQGKDLWLQGDEVNRRLARLRLEKSAQCNRVSDLPLQAGLDAAQAALAAFGPESLGARKL